MEKTNTHTYVVYVRNEYSRDKLAKTEKMRAWKA